VLRTEQLAAPVAVTAAFAATTLGIIAELNRQIIDLEAELATHFETHPDADIYLSLPGLGVVLGARVLGEFGDDPNRYTSAKCRKNYAGTSPRTVASGRKRAVLARHVRNRPSTARSTNGPSARCAPVPVRACSTTSAARPGTCTTKLCAPWETASSAFCTAAYVTESATTNTKLGHTVKTTPIPKPLDNLQTWDVWAANEFPMQLISRLTTRRSSAITVALLGLGNASAVSSDSLADNAISCRGNTAV